MDEVLWRRISSRKAAWWLWGGRLVRRRLWCVLAELDVRHAFRCHRRSIDPVQRKAHYIGAHHLPSVGLAPHQARWTLTSITRRRTSYLWRGVMERYRRMLESEARRKPALLIFNSRSYRCYRFPTM